MDSDDFDWEAAVREIDSACEAAASTSSRYTSNACVKTGTGSGNGTKMVGTGTGTSTVRQSTLERFVNSFTKRRKGNEGFVKSRVGETSAQRGDFNGSDKARVCGSTVERKDNINNNNGAEFQVPFVQVDPEAAKTWIYPINANAPKREYQYEITKLALFTNTLVVLPTGLGKTLIAAVVMFNYFRWFPEGKIVFAAPSRPLVMQQIEACHKIVGIPQEWTIYMTGVMRPAKRSEYWKTKRVFFLTPQVLQKDIENGICLVKNIVCLVIDEAHRAQGNYASCVVVKEILAIPVQLRILALTATPGSKVAQIQDVITNLSISTLEYRDEEDPDVKPYVHNRALELIQVPLGEDTSTIHNLLLDVIQPYASFLGSFGLLYRRDISNFSPCEILSIKDKFRKEPPSHVPQEKHQEIENTFFTLITLFHLRKLLSSHGIRPAYEMLVEKFKDRSFNARMSKSEPMARIKLLMQRNLSHGAPFPKLVKMMEILTDHFKTKDPKDSRVIIFSNFRGSVTDIMESLAKIGDVVKATEFIGQSSGKNSKGQTQKAQQAVLQKFREGGYNVIVATSIGEEGLDIMEVDLVICFDANVSPLRMTQRMGRTGRKRHGRYFEELLVYWMRIEIRVICRVARIILDAYPMDGSEIKGYSKKQEKNKAIKKHMRNASKSFDFYPSPRMIPHIYKPEAQLVELSIEEYIPQGGKKENKSNKNSPSPFLNKISNQERDLIAKYFKSSEWKPSLIAFPSCQAFPSSVYKVHHSFRSTNMLIDAMQFLQGNSVCKSEPFVKVESPSLSFEMEPALRDDASVEMNIMDSPDRNKFTDLDAQKQETNSIKTKSFTHNFLFGGENFITIDPSGSVSIKSVPSLPFNPSPFIHAKSPVPNKIPSQNTNLERENTEKEILNSESNESMDLSPRLTLYINEGLVPESPLINEIEMSEKVTTPLINQLRESSSEDWLLRSATGASSSVQNRPKYKRLRKLGEIVKRRLDENCENDEGIIGKENEENVLNKTRPNRDKKEKKRAFIEEEVEVSNDATVSEDELGSENEDEYEDSFIDDARNPNFEQSSQLEQHSGDMLAFYRRSLLTQSPMETVPRHLTTPHCYTSSSKTSTSFSFSSGNTNTPLTHQRPQSLLPHQIDQSSLTRDSRQSNIINRLTNNASSIQEEFENKLETRKRKLSFQQQQNNITGIASISVRGEKSVEVLDCDDICTGTASIAVQEQESVEVLDDDDDFYKSIDLDLLEAQATELLRQKTQQSNVETNSIINDNNNNNSVGLKDDFDNLCDPSFDLGF
ncbi:hypothetical protein LUZ60_007733 [Juncus effusus]|nr:hypothetical protein LUZ60_007733 [Juncus effusus]